jgi:hypothetical protein
MICPKCKSEFIEGVYICTDCKIPLVDFLPVSDEKSEDQFADTNFISVYTPISSQEVSIIKMIMEREGIPFYIKNDRLHGAVLFSIQGPGKMELFVPEECAQQVIDLLGEELGHD